MAHGLPISRMLAKELRVGDTLLRGHYEAEVVRGPYRSNGPLRLRPATLGFTIRITAGPNRIGEEGEVLYRPERSLRVRVRSPRKES